MKNTKQSGRRQQLTKTRKGSDYSRIKKWLKKYVRRIVRRRNNNETGE